MLLYITLGSNDLERSGRFYDACLGALGFIRRVTEKDEIGYSASSDVRCRFWLVSPYDGGAASFGNGSMVALDAGSRLDVEAFYAAALANGGSDEGAPGLRPFHAHFYACYVRDPDGNKLSAVCERPE
ncbi:lactoylglutathione lyase [Agrobacterium vitis]|uniref:VOC family protein n=1 Tax=Agrobacterium vitis TaxID=373 RepID=UPI0015D6D7D2|nr:VOC family protein [Agrobacterium vitis]BCH60606.1 lactoylglutathione lyase [Agrobacterium vitis]